MSIYKLIGAFLSIGGIGFLNFIVADRLGTIELHQYSAPVVVGYSLLWSVFDYVFYLLIYDGLHQQLRWGVSTAVSVSLIFTLVIAFVLTVFLAKPLNHLIRMSYSLINHGDLYSYGPYGNSIDHLFDDVQQGKKVLVYLFTLDHKSVECGYLKNYSVSEDGCPLFILKADEGNKFPNSYIEVRAFMADSKYDAFQFVDLEHNVIAIIFIVNN